MKHMKWDSQVLGLETYELERGDKLPVSMDLAEYLYAKVAPFDIKRIQELEFFGFSLCDVSVEYFLDMRDREKFEVFGIRRHTNRDIDTIMAIVGNSFYLDRFHNDPNLTERQADNLYSSWILNACSGSFGDAVFVADSTDGVLGFSSCRLSGTTGIIDLTAIDIRNLSTTVGYNLIAQDLNFFIESGMNFSRTTTQLNNTPSRRSLERFGFKEFGIIATMSKGRSR